MCCSGVSAAEIVKVNALQKEEKQLTYAKIIDEFEYYDLDDDETLNYKGEQTTAS